MKYVVVFIFLWLCISVSSGRNDSIPPVDSIMQVYGDEVVITKHSERKLGGLSVGKINLQPEAVSKLPSFFGSTDLLKILELTPGVQTSSDGSSNLHIRGGDGGHNLLLYADAPLYTPGHLMGFFPLFNPDPVSVLEVEKSTVSSRSGGRLNATLHIDPNTKIPQKTTVKGNAGILASQATLELPIGKNFGIYLSGRTTYLDLLVIPLLNATVNDWINDNINGLDYNFRDVNATFIGNLSEKDRLQLDFFYGQDRLAINDPNLLINGQFNWHNSIFSARWERNNGENRFSHQIYHSDNVNLLHTYQGMMNMVLQSEIREIGYKNRFQFQIGEQSVETGLQYAFHYLQPQTFEMINLQSAIGEQPASETAHQTGIYVESPFKLSSQLMLYLGLRGNFFFREKGFFDLEPRLSLHYQLNETSALHGSYNRQHQYLHLLSPTSMGLPLDFYVSASRSLPPQSGHLFSVGYFKSFWENDWEISADIYYRNMNHVTEYVQTITSGKKATYLEQTYSGKGRAYGLELIVKKNFGAWNGWISYTLGRSERQFPQINRGQPFPARFDRLHDLSLTSSYRFNEKWEASLVYIYATGNAFTLPSSWYFINNTPVKEYAAYNSARMPAYNRMDLSVQYWYKKDNGIIFSIYNVFMVNNPLYIFLNVERDDDTGKMEIEVRHNKLFTVMPSVSWRFRF